MHKMFCNKESIIEIAEYLCSIFAAESAKITWVGGEDKSSLVLGNGNKFQKNVNLEYLVQDACKIPLNNQSVRADNCNQSFLQIYLSEISGERICDFVFVVCDSAFERSCANADFTLSAPIR